MICVGRHRLLCGDLTRGDAAILMAGELADVIYVDPPWGGAAVQLFATMHAPGSTQDAWPVFLARFAEVCAKLRKPNAPVFVEMGLRWVADLDVAMSAVGLPVVRRWQVTYGTRSKPAPATVALFGPTRAGDLRETHGIGIVRCLLAPYLTPDAVVLDPCVGLGTTARVVHEGGARLRGLELVQSRLERTEAWLRKAVARHP